MKKFAIRIIVAVVLIFFALRIFDAVVSSPDADRSTNNGQQEWFEGGNLHSSTIEEWNNATSSNKLATSSDWVTAAVGWDDLDEAREKATELRTCVDEVAKEAPSETKSSDLAVNCMVLFGWEPKE